VGHPIVRIVERAQLKVLAAIQNATDENRLIFHNQNLHSHFVSRYLNEFTPSFSPK
jgi:hypothetical protein